MKKVFFTCLLCKKIREANQLEILFKDGSPMCRVCGDEIRGAFHYYIEGEKITKEEFDKKIKEDKEREETK